MKKITFELPFYNPTCGGVLATMDIAEHIEAHVMFQNETQFTPKYKNISYCNNYDKAKPYDVLITYSDNPKMRLLNNGGDIKIFMQSYGMAKQEKYNATQKFADVLCTTKKIHDAIALDGGSSTIVGYGVNAHNFADETAKRDRVLAILYHDMESKKYKTAVRVADRLYDMGIISGVLSFGGGNSYKMYRHPKGLIKHFHNASREEVKKVFNNSMCYLSPSVSEGLNLTPIESTLCGCPAVLCDGDIGGVFEHGRTCFIANKENIYDMMVGIEEIVSIFAKYSDIFRYNMEQRVKGKDWKTVAEKIYSLCK